MAGLAEGIRFRLKSKATHAVGALRMSQVPIFRRRYRGCDLGQRRHAYNDGIRHSEDIHKSKTPTMKPTLLSILTLLIISLPDRCLAQDMERDQTSYIYVVQGIVIEKHPDPYLQHKYDSHHQMMR